METCSADERGKLQNEYEGRSEASDYRSTRPNKINFVKIGDTDRYMVLRWPNAASPFYTGEPAASDNRGRVNYEKLYAMTQDEIDAEARRALEELGET